MPRYLVVANQTLAGEPLVSRIRELARADPSSFHVVVPATPPRDHVWTEGEARATARSRLDAAMARFAGLESAFTTFCGVPEEVLMDNPRALVVRHDAARRTVQFNDKLIAFAKHWGFAARACAPYRARTKGKTESGVGYVKKNAIAGHSFAT